MYSFALRRDGSPARFRALRLWLLFWLCLAGLRCSDSDTQTTVSVTVVGLTSDLQSMSFDATLDGRALVSPAPRISPTTDSLTFLISLTDTGLLDLTVSGFDSTGCQLAAGESQVTLAGDLSYSTTVTLSFDTTHKGCSVLLSNTGDGVGRIVDKSGNILCDFSTLSAASSCQLFYTQGTTLSLVTEAGDHSYFAGWTSGCTGTSDCSITIQGAPQPVTAVFLRDRLCSGQLCWQQPLPQGNDLYAVFGLASSDVWMAGEVGTILHWNGIYTEYFTSGTTQPLRAIWGTGNNDLWAVGDQGVILHRQNNTFSVSSSGTTANLHALWGSDSSNVWAAGDGGTLLKWDGSGWSLQSSSSTKALYGLWGTTTAVWAVGDSGTVLKWNGAAWSAQVIGTTAQLTSVFGTSDDDVWAVGQSGTIAHFDGTTWTVTTAPQGPTGGTVTLRSVWGSAQKDVWAVGEFSTILHYDGAWSVIGSGQPMTLYGVWGASGSDVWAVGETGTLLHNTGVFFASIAQSQASLSLQGLFGAETGSVWAVGRKGEVLRSVTSRWTSPASLDGIGTDYTAVTGRSATDVWLAGSRGIVMHWDGTALTAVSGAIVAGTFTDNLNAIIPVGAGPGNIMAVGDNGTIISYNGASWVRQIPSSAEVYNGIWGPDVSNLWVVGNGGILRHFVGSGFNLDAQSGTVTTSNLRAVWGSASTAVWAVGDNGTIVHYDGSRWAAQTSGTTATLYAVSGTAATDVWAVGAGGTILHYDGQSWSPFSPGTTAHDLYAVWTLKTGYVLFAGAGGIILNYVHS